MNRVRLSKQEQNRFSRDLATPEERQWLDAWEKEVNPALSPSIVNDRCGRGGIWVLVHLRRRLEGSAFGTYLTTLDKIKSDVEKERLRARLREKREIAASIGAFI